MPDTPFALAMLSTYPPTQCGLATFNAALLRHVAGAVSVVRVLDAPEPPNGAEVVAHLVNGDRASAARAVAVLNEHDAVIVQHEYGIYGGPDGRDVLQLVAQLTVPTVVVLHTVLEHPSFPQRHILEQLLAEADVAVTMTEAARQRLLSAYGADPSRVVVVPHGAVGPESLSVVHRAAGDRPMVLTWGLLGPGKGIEWAIDAMAGLRDLQPDYLVLGRTHPKVRDAEGETYRDALQARAAAAGVLDLVRFDDSYLSVPELAQLVQQADVVLLPYDSQDQVTSGVLVEAVAAGKPVVSTAFPHAVELLSDGLGLVVPQGDARALQAALRRVLTEPGLAEGMAGRARDRAPELLWPAVAKQYLALAEGLVAAALAAAS